VTTLHGDDLRQRLARVRLLTTDVDGVLTDGGLYCTDSGEEFRRFHVRDGQGLQLVMRSGIEVAFVSAHAPAAVLQRARKLGIPHVLLGVEDKLRAVEDLGWQLGISLAEVAHIGDDVNDLPLLRAVGCPLTVADAMPDNRACALYVTTLAGGTGAVREICDLLVESRAALGGSTAR
jgi:3-deoxy-D-manno-octulosonate 8-phosphate phosphatase (KDO 8-P phosphatase)